MAIHSQQCQRIDGRARRICDPAKIVALAANPGLGHERSNLTNAPVKFFPVYSYLIVYLPETNPLEVVSILHGYRDVERILQERL